MNFNFMKSVFFLYFLSFNYLKKKKSNFDSIVCDLYVFI